MLGRLLIVLWKSALAFLLIKCVADMARDGQSILAIAAVVLPIGIVMLVRARGSGRTLVPVIGRQAEREGAVFHQLSEPDKVRIASLAASGNAIGAIKALRKLVDIDLHTAKDTVDRLAAHTDDEGV